ncbi:hypothetical protein [Rhizobium sp. NZLR11]|uniref:hypothetical protein n=1 Tax=Rhizobium sp. NZLR11 TaxID=2731098 RepID=UPI001C828B09|nr:hypothetical protein [Rhizobium sp. NZLR11]MBX5206693.1 hypothetical protein [Rhizobium sp. NZLR11]
MTDLEKQAAELGIKVDKRWSDERLQQEIDKTLAAPAAGQENPQEMKPAYPVNPAQPVNEPAHDIGMDKKEKTTPVKLLYDTWLEADVRTPAGEVVDLPLSKAKEMISQGKAARADKFPGE